jgi:hypothetical protein
MVELVKRKKLTIDTEVLILVATYILLIVGSFFLGAGILVLGWDWTAAAMFHAPAAPYTAGMGIMLVLSTVFGGRQVTKDRK